MSLYFRIQVTFQRDTTFSIESGLQTLPVIEAHPITFLQDTSKAPRMPTLLSLYREYPAISYFK